MSDEDFNIVPDGGKDAKDKSPSCPGGCPLALVPSQTWRELLRPPFRKRHPFIYWISIFAALVAGFSLGNYLMRDKSLDGKERIALVSVSGPIMNVSPLLDWIRKIENNSNVKGVLLRVDSPGGGAAASQEVYSALARIAAKKPIAASMGATAASGGLMVSMAAERIFANPSTVTGSIGVRMDIPQLQQLMGKLGIGLETLVAGNYKDAASYARPLSPEDRAYLQGILDNMHAQFVEIVAKGRNMPIEKARSLANGKIYTGQEAKSLGLVDEMGGQEQALAWLAQKTGIPASRELLKKNEKRNFFMDAILGMTGNSLSDEHVGEFLDKLGARLAAPAFSYQF